MREIEFRGLSIHGGRVYGYYAHTSRFSNTNDYYKHVIITQNGENREIEPKTIGQDTGLLDCSGKKIYEGDVCLKNKIRYQVKYHNDRYYCGFILWDISGNNISHGDYNNIEVIGNIHQN